MPKIWRWEDRCKVLAAIQRLRNEIGFRGVSELMVVVPSAAVLQRTPTVDDLLEVINEAVRKLVL
jgi:hypothetical protein